MKKFLICLILFYSTLISAQSIKLGFDLEASQIRVNGNKILGYESLPFSFHLNVIYSPSNKVSILSKIGRSLVFEFAGWEFGVAGKYKFFNPFYISAGFLQHSNEGGSSSNTRGTDYASILMLYGGLGIDIMPFMALELGYYHPTSKEIIGGARLVGTDALVVYTFERMFRLGFIFAWEL